MEIFQNEDIKAIQDRVKFYRSHGYSGAISMERQKQICQEHFTDLLQMIPKVGNSLERLKKQENKNARKIVSQREKCRADFFSLIVPFSRDKCCILTHFVFIFTGQIVFLLISS